MTENHFENQSRRSIGSESDRTRDILQASPDLKDVADSLADYLAGFVLINEDKARFLGSGTLVRTTRITAILTAGHVLARLPERGRVGLVLPTRFEPMLRMETLRMEYTKRVCLGRGENMSDGPDIGVLVMPDLVASKTIPSTKTFYNLLKRQETALSSPIVSGIDQSFGDGDSVQTWVLSGIPAESEVDGPPEAGFDVVKELEGLMGLGSVVSKETAKGFDYLNFSAVYDEIYEGPRSFEGFSGGSLWRLRGVMNRDEFILKEFTLMGVPFWQSDRIGSERIIKCHGPKSIYERLLDKTQRES